MIRTVTVCAGENNCALAAHQYAIEIARWFGARLRVVSAWEAEEIREDEVSGEGPEELARQELQPLLARGREEGLRAEESLRPEGYLRGLLAEARESDLLVLGMPTEGGAQDDPVAAAILAEELPLLRRAECMVLVVCDVRLPIKHVLVNYQGGVEGKSALRIAGELAERNAARVVVISIEPDIGRAAALTAVAQEYLKGFRLPSVDIVERSGDPESETEIFEAAESSKADIVVVGNRPYGLLDRFFGKITPEQIALDTELPLLIAR